MVDLWKCKKGLWLHGGQGLLFGGEDAVQVSGELIMVLTMVWEQVGEGLEWVDAVGHCCKAGGACSEAPADAKNC